MMNIFVKIKNAAMTILKSFPAPLLLVLLAACAACTGPDRHAAGDAPAGTAQYLGMDLPGADPVLFAPGRVSTRRNERDMAIAPGIDELFYSCALPGFSLSCILTIRFDGRAWTGPAMAPFSGRYNDLEPAFTPDGTRLFFISRRPLTEQDSTDDWNIWHASRMAGGWSDPVPLGPPVNSAGDEFYPSVAAGGNLYFTAEDLPGSLGGEDIYMVPYRNGIYGDPVNLGPGVNSAAPEFNAWVAPDESMLIFSSWGRDDGHGGGDLYISFRQADGTWQEARNMGPDVNSDRLDYCPLVTPDGRFLFFTSQRLNPRITDREPKDLATLQHLEDGPQNGLGDLYWMAFEPHRWK